MTRFLVVDDDPITVRAMPRLLRSDGHEVCMVHQKPIDYETLSSALDACRARGGPGGDCSRYRGGQDLASLRRT
jgi:CheY-like chemotaxis protein